MVDFFVESGPDRGTSFTVDTDRATFGRGDENTCPLKADDTVAERHAVALRRGDTWYIAPYRRAQTAPVLVNGQPARRPTRLHYGDRITIGQTVLEYSYAIDSPEQLMAPWQMASRGRVPNVIWALFICLISVASAVALFRQNLPPTNATGNPDPTGLPVVALDNATPAATDTVAPPTEPPTTAPTIPPTDLPPQPTGLPQAATDMTPTSVPPSVSTPIPPTPARVATAVPTTAPPPTPTPGIAIAAITAAPTDSPTAAFLTLDNGCQVPAHWQRYTVQWGDTLWRIAERFQTTATALIETNCIENEMIYADATLYVPPLP